MKWNLVRTQRCIKHTHKNGDLIRLLATGCNTAIKICQAYWNGLWAFNWQYGNKIKDTANLLEIIDNLNTNGLPENTLLISFDTVIMFPNNDNMKGIHAVNICLDNK